MLEKANSSQKAKEQTEKAKHTETHRINIHPPIPVQHKHPCIHTADRTQYYQTEIKKHLLSIEPQKTLHFIDLVRFVRHSFPHEAS